ncbi:MAG: DUF4382 domain-containing protein [Terriglobia bacterium]
MRRRTFPPLPFLVGAVLTVALLASCGGGTQTMWQSTTGGVRLTLSDPPTCKAPIGDFTNVWVTVTRVRAHISSTASPDDAGWVDLVDLRSSPKQIDLLSIGDTTCTLATLGSTSGLPPGNYQQIRLYLLSNNPAASEATPSPNNCGANGYNCAQLDGGITQTLLLSSEDKTGIKIPPGQIAGGAIQIEAGKTADLNIDFSACQSILRQGNGQFRLKPTLHAGEVSLTTDSISGKVVDGVTGIPIPNATIFVLAEQPDSDGIDRIVRQRTANATDGTFTMCPLPAGNYDIVVAAVSGAGVTYNATITFHVPTGTALGNILLTPETGTSTAPAEIDGEVSTAATVGTATGSDIGLSAFQEATPSGGSATLVTIPLLPGSTENVATDALLTCASGTKCASYSLYVPASNPVVGTFTTSGTIYAGPVVGDVLYHVNARAFVPGSGGTANCSPSSLTTDKDNQANPLKATAGTSVTAQALAFTGCTEGY